MLKQVCRSATALALAIFLSQLAHSPVAQAASATAVSSPIPLVLAQRGPDRDDRAYRDGRGYRDDRRPPPRQFDRDYRDRRPPPGWRHYSSRPRNWQRRGCTAIGPIWYCP